MSATNFPRACHLWANANPISDYSLDISIESRFLSFSLSLSFPLHPCSVSWKTSYIVTSIYRWSYVTTDKEDENKVQEEKTRKVYSWNTNNDDDALKKKERGKKGAALSRLIGSFEERSVESGAAN